MRSTVGIHCLQAGEDVKLKARKRLVLQPITNARGRLLLVRYAKLCISVFAFTPEKLETELNEQISMLWREYALADDDELDGGAVRLKRALLGAFCEVTQEENRTQK